MSKRYFVIVLIIILATLGYWYLSQNFAPRPNEYPSPTSTIVTTSTGQTTSSSPRHQLPPELDYDVNAPNGVLVTDPSGRQTGNDPTTGNVYEGIPNSTYAEAGSRVVRIVSPEAGQYTIQVIGGAPGSYFLATDVSDGINVPKSQLATGTIQIGSVATYLQPYDPNNLQGALVALQGTASSTAGMIASSSKPLPPCALPPFKVNQQPCPVNASD